MKNWLIKNTLYGVIHNKNTQKRKLAKLRLRFNKNVNIFIGEKLTEEIKTLFFQKEPNIDDGSITVHYKGDPWLTQIMRDIGIFKSVSQAKGSGWHRKAKEGFYHEVVTVGKVPHNICIYKETVNKEK